MLFGEFVQEVSKGNNKLYLTTQDAAVAKDGFPELLSRPVQDLARDIPLCPALLGGLVPQSINMWMGCSPDGSSTGLHHDFHDNLYVLLRGRKRFRLYSPNMADLMLTNGELQMVHPNGRIVYKGDGRIRADGAEVHDAAAWEARHKAETELAGASCHDDSDVDEDDSAMEAALDMMLDGAMENSPVLEDDFVDSGDEGDSGSEPTWIEEPSSFSSIDLQLDDEELQRMHQAFPVRTSPAS